MKIGDLGSSSKPYYNIELWGNGTLQTEFFDGYGANSTSLSIQSMSANTWYYVAVTYDYVSQYMNFYVDGILQGSNYIGNPIPGVRDHITIGATDKNTLGFDGLIDEVRFSNRVLSPEEIYLQYTTNLSKIDTGSWILSYWPDFDTTLKQPVFGYSEDSAGNRTWTSAKTLIRDDTPPQITMISPTIG